MSKNKISLITGVTGQDGYYLAKLLLSVGHTVIGLARRSSVDIVRRLDADIINNNHFFLHYTDYSKFDLRNIISETRPHYIYNLVGQSYVGSSFDSPEHTFKINTLIPLSILECINSLSLNNFTSFYQASTSEMFGNTRNTPLSIFAPRNFVPVSPYGISKLTARDITKYYSDVYDIRCFSGILFNHESRRRQEYFVTQKIIYYALELLNAISKSKKLPTLNLGNNSLRDWGYAKEYVFAMYKMMTESDKFSTKLFSEYEICTGHTCSVKDFVEQTFKVLGIRPSYLELVKFNEVEYRPCDVTALYGDISKFEFDYHWTPKVKLTNLIEIMCGLQNE